MGAAPEIGHPNAVETQPFFELAEDGKIGQAIQQLQIGRNGLEIHR